MVWVKTRGGDDSSVFALFFFEITQKFYVKTLRAKRGFVSFYLLFLCLTFHGNACQFHLWGVNANAICRHINYQNLTDMSRKSAREFENPNKNLHFNKSRLGHCILLTLKVNLSAHWISCTWERTRNAHLYLRTPHQQGPLDRVALPPPANFSGTFSLPSITLF